MRKSELLKDIEVWRSRLGLFPVPLYHDKIDHHSYVLLNGSRGNFCLAIGDDEYVMHQGHSIAWSSNIGHCIRISKEIVEVQSWEKGHVAPQRFTAESVYDNLLEFHTLLEHNSPRYEHSIIAHAIAVFRSLRSSASELNGTDALRAFLVLLHTAATSSHGDRESTSVLSSLALQAAGAISSSRWDQLLDVLMSGPLRHNLTPIYDLTLRHASGLLFQEAHYESTCSQLTLDEFLPSPVQGQKMVKSTGSYFTPPALARALVEEAIKSLDLTKNSIEIFDPACGSGEFLRESLRQLNLLGYQGKVNLIGWDISEAACDLANFVLAWESQNISKSVSFEINEKNALENVGLWPQVDLVIMNPPFVSWRDMDDEQKNWVNDILQ